MKDHTTAEIFEELWKRIEYDANVSEELATESNELQERIDKAIEYIENSDDFDVEVFNEATGGCLGTDLSKGAKQLLEILKGEENEKRNTR